MSEKGPSMDTLVKSTVDASLATALETEEELRLAVKGQKRILQLVLNARRFQSKAELLVEASQLAVDLTGADSGLLYFRTKADPRSRRIGETIRYRRAYRITRPFQESSLSDVAPLNVTSLTPVYSEEVGRYAQIALLEGGRRLIVPIEERKKLLAVLDLYADDGQGFQDLHVALAAEVATQVGALLQNQRTSAARTALLNLAQAFAAELDLTTLLEQVAQAAAEITTAQSGSILLIQPQGDTLRFAATYGLSHSDQVLMRGFVVPLKGSIAGTVVETGKPLISNDVASDPRFFSGVSNTVELKTRSLLAVPLIARERIIGVLEVINQKYDDGFDEEDVTVLNIFATQAAIAIENARLLAEREARMSELMKLEQRKSQFIALASHELRTPLNIVSGYATLLRSSLEAMDPTLVAEAMDWLEQIEQGAVRLTNMVNNITSMHNLETGRTRLLLAKQDVRTLIQEVMDEYREWSRAKGIQLVYEPAEEPLIAICDAIEAKRILGNLVNNAVKFTPEGGQIQITATLQPATSGGLMAGDPERQEVLIGVSDTGPGIAPEQLSAVFERFSQLNNHLQRTQGGMGLGLPLAKALAEKHGGRLWAERNPSVGMTFYFTLPAPRITSQVDTEEA